MKMKDPLAYKFNSEKDENCREINSSDTSDKNEEEKGEKAVWKAYAESKGTKVVTMIKEYMRGCIEADGFTVPEAEEAPEKVEEK